MEKGKISVIIPVYNREKYVRKCVDSVLAQTYQNLEIILVDDGSTDSCPAICDELTREDSRITAIHQQNGGASAARNAGIDIAVGEYIGFVDSDDYIAPDMYEKLYNALTAADADLSMCDFIYVDEEGRTLESYPCLDERVIDSKQVYERMEFGEETWRYITLVNRLYRRELFDSYRLKVGKICEDEFSAHHIYAACRRIAVISDVLYWNVKTENSVMTSPISIKRLAGAEARLERYDFFQECGYRVLARSALWQAYSSLWLVLKYVNVYEYREDIRPYVRRVVKEQLKMLDILRAAKLGALYLAAEQKGKMTEASGSSRA